MKRIAISELEGAALDWAVAKAAGENIVLANPNGISRKLLPCTYHQGREPSLPHYDLYHPSTDWSQCGPLIERYRVDVLHEEENGEWLSSVDAIHCAIGTTPLIAACRAIVASHNPSGYVEVPDELLHPDNNS